MRTLLKYVLPVLFAALLSGCGASLVRKVRIGEEVAVRQYGTVGLDLTFEVENASRRTLRLEEAELEFFTGAGSLGRAEGFCRSSRAESRPGVQSLEIRFSRCRRRNGPSEAIGGGGLRPAGGRSADDAAGGGRAAPCFFRKDAFFRIFEYLCRR